MTSYDRHAMSPLPLLSFCIPTYNRLERVRPLVQSILSLPDPDIEVVVLDNGSTDGTLEALRQVDDPRFQLRSNGENRGALYNMVHVFGHASGRYVVYSTDQDATYPEGIAAFKAFLIANPELTCGFCGFDLPANTPNQQFDRGIQAITAIAYRGRHPTGYFFRNDVLKLVRLPERFGDFERVHLFPLEFAFAEAALQGHGAIYNRRLFSPNNSDDVVKHKSATTDGASKNAFFAPAARLKLAVSYADHVESLALPVGDKARLIANLFIGELRAATVGYRAVVGNARLCAHYRMAPRAISRKELIAIAYRFFVDYFKARFTGRARRAFPFLTSVGHAVGVKAVRRLRGR
jgi:glycosyltransferase involved in cell wall biosynthesis